MYEFMYFALGVLAYRIISTVINYGHLAEHVTLVNEQTLRVLGAVTEDISFARGLKYKTLHESGMPEDEVEKIKIVDDRSYQVWKDVTIGRIIYTFPKHYRHLIKYIDWQGAMKELEHIYKRDMQRLEKIRKKNLDNKKEG
jgi:hypothetical protein